ncbi:MAG: porin, partial [Desulfobulbaceae bacterium]|nr:porin [Desulfobulbaceae bacterium]
MKKVIATAAGLVLVGAMAGSALAEVNVTGDARARFYTKDNYDLNSDADDDNSKVESRVRMMVDGKYENAFAKARVNIGDGTWDDGKNTGADVKSDYAFLGLNMGPTTVTMGRQIADFGYKFFIWDARKDRLKGSWNVSDATTLVA